MRRRPGGTGGTGGDCHTAMDRTFQSAAGRCGCFRGTLPMRHVSRSERTNASRMTRRELLAGSAGLAAASLLATATSLAEETGDVDRPADEGDRKEVLP